MIREDDYREYQFDIDNVCEKGVISDLVVYLNQALAKGITNYEFNDGYVSLFRELTQDEVLDKEIERLRKRIVELQNDKIKP